MYLQWRSLALPISNTRSVHQRALCSLSDNAAQQAGPSSPSVLTSASSPALATPDDVIQVTFRGRTVQVKKGSRLRTSLLKAGLSPHNGDARLINCRGLGTCGTCAVEISQGEVRPPQWTTAEQLRLNFPPHGAPGNRKLRLACQVRCCSDLEVVKYGKFWGEGPLPLVDLPVTTHKEKQSDACATQPSGEVLSTVPIEIGGGKGEEGERGNGARAGRVNQGGQAPEPVSRLGVGMAPLGQWEYVLDKGQNEWNEG